MSEELKPCPCGAQAEKEPYAINASNDLFRLDCTRAECGWCVVSPTIEQAFIDWNTRAELSAIKGGGEAGDQEDNIKHLSKCGDDGCERCENLMNFYQACDHCGTWGHNDADPCSCSPPVVAEAEPVGSKVGAIEGGVVPGWRVTGRGGYSLCVQYPEWAEGCDDLKIEQLFAAPPASGAVPVPYGFIGELHEYLDNCAQFDPAYPPETQPDNRAAALLLNLRALLAKGVL